MTTALLLALTLLGQSTLDQANKALLEGNYEKAYTLYQQVLKNNPNQYEALINAAFAASKLRKTEEAFNLYSQAWQIQKDPRRVGEPLVNLGLQLGTRYILEKKWSDAERTFRIVTSVDPNNAIGWFNLGYALEQLGQLEEAVNAYQKAQSLKPSSNTAEALNRVRRALDRQRLARATTFRRRAERALSQGDTARAIAWIDSVLRLDPRNTWARDIRAQIQQQEKTRAIADSLRQVLASLLASDSLKALPVVRQLLTLQPGDSNLLALQATLEELRQRRIQAAAAKTQETPKKGVPIGLIAGGIVVLLLLVGAILLLRGRKEEEMPSIRRVPEPTRTTREPPRPATPPKPTPPPPAEPEPSPAEPEPTTETPKPEKIRVIEGIPMEEEETAEEPVPKDVVIRAQKAEEGAEKAEQPAAEETPEEAEVPPEETVASEKKAEPMTVEETPPAEKPAAEEEPAAEEVVEEKPSPAETPAAPETPKAPPSKPAEEAAPAKPAEEEKPKPRPAAARPRGFAGVNAIKERAKKKRRLMLLQMLRETLGEGKEGVFGSKELEAYIYIKEGKILQAEYKGKTGQEALQAILENPKPDRFSFREKDTFFVEGDLNMTVEDLDRQIEDLKKEVG